MIFKTPLTESQIQSSLKSAADEEKLDVIRKSVAQESSERQSADTKLSNDIDALTTSLADEVTLRADQISKTKSELQKSISDEKDARISKDNDLQNQINSEKATRESADSKLRDDFISADSALLNQLTAKYDAEVSKLSTAINNESTLSANRDATLAAAVNSSITTEISNRQAEDAKLRADLTAEVNTRKSQTDSLSSAITKEISDRNSAVTNLQTNLSTAINNEATTRSAADSALQNSLKSAQDTFNAAITTEKNERLADKAALQSSITSAVNNVTASLKDFTPSTKTKDGVHGLVPAPPKTSNKLLLTQEGWEEISNTDIYIGAVPSQNGSPQYTGSAQSPQWINYESEKLSIDGSISGTDAKEYSVTFTPKGLYCWADGTRTSKTVYWRIYPKVITIPTATTTEYIYSGNSITLNVSNPNADGSSQTGTISATNVGNYTATYKLKSTTNYVWSDNTTTDKSIAWKISAKSIAIPTAAVTSFDYTGNKISLNITNPDADSINKTGTDSATAAATYTVTFALKSTSNFKWSDGTTTNKTITWTIAKKKLAKPSASTTTFTYNKASQGLTVSNYDSNYINKTGTDTAIAAGSYSVTFTLKDTSNYSWTDNTNTAVKIDWKIDILKLAKPSASTTSFEYDGKVKSITVSNFNSNYMSQLGTTSEINANNYTATYVLGDSTNTKWADNSTANVVINWIITRKKLTAAQSTFSQDGTLTYNGTSQSVKIKNFDANYHVLSGETSCTNALIINVAEIDVLPNYAWSNGSTETKRFEWSIQSCKLDKPTAAKTEFEYTGATFTLDVSNYNENLMTRTGTWSASADGDYSVTFTLKNAPNYIWSDNSNDDVTIDWKIKTNKITKPTLAASTFEYTGSNITPTINNLNETYVKVTGDTSGLNVGSYTITFALIDKSGTVWADNKTDDFSLTFTITRKKLTATQSTFSQSGTLTYTGNSQNVSITNFNENYHTKSSETSATNAGTYTAKVTPKDNYAWSDGTYAAKTVTWSIGAMAITKPTAAKTSFEYDGSEKTLTISNYNSNRMTKSGTESASLKGSYTLTFTLNSTNFKWADNSTAAVNINWTIGAKALTKPTLSGDSTFTYDGNAKTITVKNYDSSTMIFSGTLSETNAGNYSATYELRDKDNYTWAGGSTNNVTLTWKINAIKLSTELSTGFAQNGTPPTFSFNGSSYAGGGHIIYYIAGHTVDITNYDSDCHKLSGVYFAGYAGTYTAYVSPADNYCWADGSSNPIAVTWTINKLTFSKPSLNQTTFKYTGNRISPGIVNNTFYFVFNGTSSATNVGKYSFTAGLTVYFNDYFAGGTGPKTRPKGENLTWSDGTSDDIELSWEIVMGDGLTKPTLSKSEVEWTGSNVSPTISGFDSNTMNKSGTETATALGTYNITISLKDKNNTQWADGSTDDVTLTWKVVRQKLSAAYSTFSQKSITYNGKVQNIADFLNGYSSTYHDLSGQVGSTVANTYTVNITPKSTYAWSDGTFAAKSFQWSIGKQNWTKPTIKGNSSFIFDGNNHEVVFNNWDASLNHSYANYINRSGAWFASDVGNHTVKFDLKDTANNQWTDSSTGTVELTWSITPLRLTKPSLTNTSWTYDTNAHSPTINNFNSTYENQSGSDTATNAGTYTVTFSLKSTTNTTWADSTTGEVKCTWTINKATPTLTLSTNYVTLDNATHITTVTATYTGDGSLSASTSDSDVATASVSNKTITLWAQRNYGKSTTITVSASAGTNYISTTATFTATTYFIDELKNYTDWNHIAEVVRADKASTAWDVGDATRSMEVRFELRDGFADSYNNALKFSRNPMYAIILGINHSDTKTSGCNMDMAFSNDSNSIKATAYRYGKTVTGWTYDTGGLAHYIDKKYPLLQYLYVTNVSNILNFNPTVDYSRIAYSSTWGNSDNYSVYVKSGIFLLNFTEVVGGDLGGHVIGNRYAYFKNGNKLPMTASDLANGNDLSNVDIWVLDRGENINNQYLKYYYLRLNSGSIVPYQEHPTASYAIIPCFRIT